MFILDLDMTLWSIYTNLRPEIDNIRPYVTAESLEAFYLLLGVGCPIVAASRSKHQERCELFLKQLGIYRHFRSIHCQWVEAKTKAPHLKHLGCKAPCVLLDDDKLNLVSVESFAKGVLVDKKTQLTLENAREAIDLYYTAKSLEEGDSE